MKTKKFSRFLCLLVCVVMVFTMLPEMSITAEAAATNEIALPTSPGSILSAGKIYRVNGNTTISGGIGDNALNVKGGDTVVIYIPTGYTLTVYGGSGNSTNPGGAGICIPSNSTLVLTGGGRLVAKGGDSGYSNRGANGGTGYVQSSMAITGGGGSGGFGAGGAGAGIGGKGGNGSSGGSGGNSYGYYDVTYYSDSYGNDGARGASGWNGGDMGDLYVLGTVSVTATGGGGAGGASGGSSGTYNYRRFHNNGSYSHTASGGGGGGGGGSTVSASGIGGGSGGAGGGGGGGSGARWSSRDTWWAHCGYGGNPGAGGIGGSTGLQESNCGQRGGNAGNGGSRGRKGSEGKLYRSKSATVNDRNADGIKETISVVSSKITFDNQGGTVGTGGVTTLDVAYGDFVFKTIIPTRDMYSFMGYYTEPKGAGTRYFDHRGAELHPLEFTGNVTLYAHWVQNQFNVTFDKQTGKGGTDSVITTGIDGALPIISPPTKDNALFKGYHDAAAGGGIKYYDTAGTPITGRKITANTVLYAFWEQTQFRITFGRQGGIGGDDFTFTDKVKLGELTPIIPPTKQGAAFLGYFTQSTGGTQVYDSTGTPIAGNTFMKDTMLYAQWKEATYKITYLLNGGMVTGAPAERPYAQPTTIPTATKAGYAFIGWQVDNITGVSHRNLTIQAFDTAYAKDITLTAIWVRNASTDVQVLGNVTLAAGNDATIKTDLENSFGTVVPSGEGNKGITSNDLANENKIKLVISVDVSTNDTDKTMIDGVAQGTALSFYDISAKKEVIAPGFSSTTPMVEIPEPIAVKIPLAGDLAGKASYRVYRVHGGIAEALPSGPTGEEYYSVEDGNIVIRTRKFSTYGVVGAQSQISNLPGDIFERGAENVDVQGKVLEGASTMVYKVDIAWGPMAFEYSLNKEWDPVTHLYTEGALNAWKPTCFEKNNNVIRSINHSNGAVKINLAVTQNDLKGVDMSLHMFNEITSTLAPNFILPPAPVGSLDKDLEPAVAYLFLSGSPDRTWIDANKKNFAKVGVITVTVEPHTL